MTKIVLTLAFILSVNITNAQYISTVSADSVKITNDSCNAELILENNTKAQIGFLYNYGIGRTEFRPTLEKIGIGFYLLGYDTLNLKLSASHSLQTSTTNGNSTTSNIISGEDSYFQLVKIGKGGGNLVSNTALGTTTLLYNQTGSNNVAIGWYTMTSFYGPSNTIGHGNVSIGESALNLNSTGNANTTIGFRSTQSNTTGSKNTVLGSQANIGPSYMSSSRGYGSSNIALGLQTMAFSYKTSGNVAIGTEALFDSLNGSYSVAIGHFAARSSKADSSVFIGLRAGQTNLVANSLFIDNSNTATPLIHGNFKSDSVRLNGKLSVRDIDSSSNPTNLLFITREGRIKKVAAPGGGGSVTTISHSHGLLGGTITSSGTLYFDSTLYSTNNWLQKGLDSLAFLTKSIDTAVMPGIDDNFNVPAKGVNLVVLQDLSTAPWGFNLFMPETAEEGKVMYFFNQNTSPDNLWIFNGTNVPIDTVGNEFYALDNQTVYTVCFADGRWRIVSKY